MPTATILYIILAALVAAGLAIYFYFLGKKRETAYLWLLTLLRFISLFAVFLLFINPKFVQNEFFLEKPELILAVDNSASIAEISETEKVAEFIQYIEEHEGLNERFNINAYTFGAQIKSLDSLSFTEAETNIYDALHSLNRLNRDKATATLLVTDGNQTFGRDYVYFSPAPNHAVIPVVVGDTTSYEDLQVSQVNVNQYAFLENKFPVEVFIDFKVEKVTEAKFEITTGNRVLHSQILQLSPNENSKILTVNLPANSIGQHVYEVRISTLENEKNIQNNRSKFSVEVIDERSKILLLSSISHPDLGAIKNAVESNEQRKTDIEILVGKNLEMNDYQLIILYQPNNKFKPVFEKLKKENFNYLLVTGTETDWNFLNTIQDDIDKNAISETEDFVPILNENYPSFQIEKIEVDNYPPLKGIFGDVKINAPHDILLYKKIAGITTEEALLATYESNSAKKGVLFGEGIWRWRAQSYLETGSFENFDEFFGQLVQFLASNRQKKRLIVDYQPFYHENEEIKISAQYFDENYQFDGRQELVFSLQKKEGQERVFPFVVKANQYEVNLKGMEPGIYDFQVQVKGKGISEAGSFEIMDFSIEEQFLNANFPKLKEFAAQQQEQVFLISENEKIVQRLLDDPAFVPVQNSREQEIPLVEWKYLLAIIVLCLSAEWFIRKYHGLV